MNPPFNPLVVAAAALIPLVVGFIWYNPKVFGNVWMKAAGVSPDSAKGANMALVFGLTYLFSFFAAMTINQLCIHQFGFYSMLQGQPGITDPNSEVSLFFKMAMEKYGNEFRTFKHGALHGGLAGLFFAMPITGVGALFESKGFKYIAVHTGYWIVSLALMGGVICAYTK